MEDSLYEQLVRHICTSIHFCQILFEKVVVDPSFLSVMITKILFGRPVVMSLCPRPLTFHVGAQGRTWLCDLRAMAPT
jgi:hypothetical protein